MALPHLAIDHVFVCTELGAPAARLLEQAGSSRKECRIATRGKGPLAADFSFPTSCWSQLWLEDEAGEARDEQARGLRLWEQAADDARAGAGDCGGR